MALQSRHVNSAEFVFTISSLAFGRLFAESLLRSNGSEVADIVVPCVEAGEDAGDAEVVDGVDSDIANLVDDEIDDCDE